MYSCVRFCEFAYSHTVVLKFARINQYVTLLLWTGNVWQLSQNVWIAVTQDLNTICHLSQGISNFLCSAGVHRQNPTTNRYFSAFVPSVMCLLDWFGRKTRTFGNHAGQNTHHRSLKLAQVKKFPGELIVKMFSQQQNRLARKKNGNKNSVFKCKCSSKILRNLLLSLESGIHPYFILIIIFLDLWLDARNQSKWHSLYFSLVVSRLFRGCMHSVYKTSRKWASLQAGPIFYHQFDFVQVICSFVVEKNVTIGWTRPSELHHFQAIAWDMQQTLIEIVQVEAVSVI